MKLPRTSGRYVWFWFTHQYRTALSAGTDYTLRSRCRPKHSDECRQRRPLLPGTRVCIRGAFEGVRILPFCAHSIHLVFSFTPEAAPTTSAKLKIEINTREHENLYGIRAYPFAVKNPWSTGQVSIASFEREELCLGPSFGRSCNGARMPDRRAFDDRWSRSPTARDSAPRTCTC